MINSYNLAIIFGALEFVQNYYFAICSNIMTNILMVSQPGIIFVRHLPRIFRGNYSGNPRKKSPLVFGSVLFNLTSSQIAGLQVFFTCFNFRRW